MCESYIGKPIGTRAVPQFTTGVAKPLTQIELCNVTASASLSSMNGCKDYCLRVVLLKDRPSCMALALLVRGILCKAPITFHFAS